MRIRRKREPEPTSGPAALSADLLRDGPLLAPWFFIYRLDEELLDRARRYDHPLPVLVLEPQLLPHEHLPVDARNAAAGCAVELSRRFDLAASPDDRVIAVAMPETQPSEARAAIERIRADMWRLSAHVGGRKWNFRQIDDARDLGGAADVLREIIDGRQTDGASPAA